MDKELDLNIHSQDYTVQLNTDAAKNEFTFFQCNSCFQILVFKAPINCFTPTVLKQNNLFFHGYKMININVRFFLFVLILASALE